MWMVTCRRCNGKGWTARANTLGCIIAYTCPRCGGSGEQRRRWWMLGA